MSTSEMTISALMLVMIAAAASARAETVDPVAPGDTAACSSTGGQSFANNEVNES